MNFDDITANDSETAPIEQGLLAPPLVCVSFCDKTLWPELIHWSVAFEYLRKLFSERVIVGHNFAYDAAVYAAQFPELLPLIFKAYREGRVYDTMLCERLIHIARGCLDGEFNHLGVYQKYGYSLNDLSIRYGFGAMDKDKWRLRYGELRDVPLNQWPEGAQEYAKLDALRTFQIFCKQSYYEDFLVDAAAQARASFALHLQSCRGLITDARACELFIEQTQFDIDTAKALLMSEDIVRPDGSKDTKKAKAYMERVCAELEIPLKRTAKDGVSLNAEATRDTGDHVLMAYSLYTSASTALDKAQLLLEGSQGLPLQTSYVSPLETGRVSSRTPMAPMKGDNFTNLPRKPGLRECFVPRPGYVFCSIDGNMAELVAVAQVHHWVFGRSKLGDALNNKIDVHCMLAADMLSCSYEEAVANKKTGKYKTERQNAKYGNFGFWGGMGVKRFVATTNAGIERREDKIDLATGYRIKSAWLNTWAPESEDYFVWVKRLLGDGNATIRQFISGRVRANIDYCTTANTFFQGLVADAFKAALFNITEECFCDRRSPLFGSYPVLFLHDEIFLELREERAHEAAYRARDILLRTCNETYFPDVRLGAEPALMRAWVKAADTVHDANGRLVCWEPAPLSEVA